MKNYFKFIVAVVAVTFACFGAIFKSEAKSNSGGYCEKSNNDCGTSTLGNAICGDYKSTDPRFLVPNYFFY